MDTPFLSGFLARAVIMDIQGVSFVADNLSDNLILIYMLYTLYHLSAFSPPTTMN